MKTLTLITLMLAATMAQAKSFKVVCQVPKAQTVSVTFTGSGSVTFDEAGDTVAIMDLNLRGPGVKETFREVFMGKTQTIKAGDFMSHESYGIEASAEHLTSVEGKPVTLKMFLRGPEGHASSRVIIGNQEYHSNCDIEPTAPDVMKNLFVPLSI